jgi:hypothetical protein
MQKMENTPFMDRARFAYKPEGFAGGLLSQGDALDNYSLDAYGRMFDTARKPTGGAGAFAKDFLLSTVPVGFLAQPPTQIPGRNWIQEYAADKIADRALGSLPQKNASLDARMLKQANLFSALTGGAIKGVGAATKKLLTRLGLKTPLKPSTPPPIPRATPPPIPRTTPPPIPRTTPPPLPNTATPVPVPAMALPATIPTSGALPAASGSLAKILGTLGLSSGLTGTAYLLSKNNTERDLAQQARGTARAMVANQWMNLSPMERYMAAAFPQAARMKLEQKLGPEYSQYYQQTFGAPGAN